MTFYFLESQTWAKKWTKHSNKMKCQDTVEGFTIPTASIKTGGHREIFFIITENSVMLILENTAIFSWVLIISIFKITQKIVVSKKLTGLRPKKNFKNINAYYNLHMHTLHKPWKGQSPHFSSCSLSPTVLDHVAQNSLYSNNIKSRNKPKIFNSEEVNTTLLQMIENQEEHFVILNATATPDWYKIVSFPLFLPYALILSHTYYKNPLLFLKILP